MQSVPNHFRDGNFRAGTAILQRPNTGPIAAISAVGRPESPAAKTRKNAVNEMEALPHARVEALRKLTLALLREVVALGELSEPGEGSGLSLASEVQRFEADMIRMALVQTAGKQRRAARLLGVKITTLHRKIKHYMISIEDIQNEAALLRSLTK